MEYLTNEDYEIAEQNGIKRYTAYYRYNYLFWPKEKAITARPKGIWNQYANICKANGINQGTFYYRLRELNMSPKDAATMPAVKGGNRHKDAVFTKEVLDVAASNGISRGTAYHRYKVLGWSLEDSINISPRTYRKTFK
jgi:hypothetical protein